jgi:hypothetical protein
VPRPTRRLATWPASTIAKATSARYTGSHRPFPNIHPGCFTCVPPPISSHSSCLKIETCHPALQRLLGRAPRTSTMQGRRYSQRPPRPAVQTFLPALPICGVGSGVVGEAGPRTRVLSGRQKVPTRPMAHLNALHALTAPSQQIHMHGSERYRMMVCEFSGIEWRGFLVRDVLPRCRVMPSS